MFTKAGFTGFIIWGLETLLPRSFLPWSKATCSHKDFFPTLLPNAHSEAKVCFSDTLDCPFLRKARWISNSFFINGLWPPLFKSWLYKTLKKYFFYRHSLCCSPENERTGFTNNCSSYHCLKNNNKTLQFSSVLSLTHVRLFATLWIAACQASLSITNSQSSLRLTSIESVMPSGHLILCRPLVLLPPIPPSNRVFSIESTLHMRWPKYWSFSFSIIPSKDIPGLISFRMDWLGLLAVQGTLMSLLQHHSSKSSILRHSAFFTVQLSHPYMTTGKTIALTRRNFVGKVMSLHFSMFSRLVITFLPRSKHFLISWL